MRRVEALGASLGKGRKLRVLFTPKMIRHDKENTACGENTLHQRIQRVGLTLVELISEQTDNSALGHWIFQNIAGMLCL